MDRVALCLVLLTLVGCEGPLVKPLGSPCPLAKDSPRTEELGCKHGSSAEAEWPMLAILLDGNPSALEDSGWDGLCIEVSGVVEVDPKDDHGQYSVRFSSGQDPENPQVLRCCPHGDLGNLTVYGAAKDGDRASFLGIASGDEAVGYCIKSCTIRILTNE